MNFKECFANQNNILMEGALGERLKREYGLIFDDNVAMANLIYSENGARALSNLWNEYIDIARRYQLPFIATTPTRRANSERIANSPYTSDIISDNVAFLRKIQQNSNIEMYAGGLMGCRGDAYTGADSLSEDDAFDFHSWTVRQFQKTDVDFLYAGIMPVLSEAAGLARAIDSSGIPYIISFTIQADGKLIDGTPIADAIKYIDACTVNKPVCYMTNCVHPTIVYQSLSQPFNTCQIVKDRFRGIQANTSPLSYAELDHATDLHSSEPEKFAKEMIRLSQIGNFQIWGGCCGTDNRHMEQVAKKIT